MPSVDASASYLLSSNDNPAIAAPDWLKDNLGTLVGVPLRILLIVLGAMLVRALARRAITRVVERVLNNGAGRGDEPRRSTRGPAVLQRDASRADERREQRARTIGSVLSSIVTIVIAVMGLAMVLDQIGIALGPLLASAGVVGLAIGFGAQSLVADYLAGMLIMVEDQYGVGDSVDLGEAVGEVEHVGLRLTQIRDLNGGLWHIRNGEIMRVRNDSQEWARAVLDVSVAYDSNLEKVFDVLEETGLALREDKEYEGVLLEDPSVWGVQSLSPDGVVVRLVVKTAPLKQWGVTRELRRRAKEALDAAGIEMPFPQRTVWLRGGEKADSEGERPSIPVSR
ncbi:mechanosensitive ion channel family protein [Streptomyces sp. B-S-A8]|uniref:Mechanosensitive ion channel family protein n=1 Tax=Streptomyces solicavernae TaxID=3043614 RepID=A0ABT6RT61_9ACTN|nr:mechanosensitive ion channel family protein [Streptomyces sp. B-S-A8]MDI3387616.1 mechanosensitive ion channel family protein [Streptomyces sp. B-S-A8]